MFTPAILSYSDHSGMNYSSSPEMVNDSSVTNNYALLILVCMIFIGCNFCNMCCCVMKNHIEHIDQGSSPLTRNPSDNESCVDSDYDSDSEPLNIQLISNNEVEKHSGCTQQKTNENTAVCLSPPPPDYDSLSNYY